MDIFAEVKRLNLPLGQYVVFGGGPLMAHGIRDTSDVDLFVTPSLYRVLKADGWKETELKGPHGGLYLVNGIYEADDTWHYHDYDPAPEAIIEAADVIEGVPFPPLVDVLKWKRAFRQAEGPCRHPADRASPAPLIGSLTVRLVGRKVFDHSVNDRSSRSTIAGDAGQRLKDAAVQRDLLRLRKVQLC